MRIPSMNTGLVNTNIQAMPTQSVESAGMVERATAQTLQQGANVALQFGQILKQEEQKAFAVKAQSSYLKEADDLYNEMSTMDIYKSSPEGFHDAYRTRLEKLKQRKLSEANNDYTRKYANEVLTGMDSNFLRQAGSFERNQRLTNVYNAYNEDVNNTASLYVDKFDPTSTNKFVNDKARLRAQFQTGNLFSSEQAKEGVKNIDGRMFDAMIDNALNNPNTVDQTLGILEGKHKHSSLILDGVDSRKVGDAISKLQRIKSSNVTISKSRINDKLQDIKAAIGSGNFLDDNNFADAMALIDPSFDNAPELTDSLMSLKVMNDKFKNYIDADGKQKEILKNDIMTFVETKDPSFNAKDREEYKEFFRTNMIKLNQDFNKNGVDYVTKDRRDLKLIEASTMDLTAPTEELKRYVKDFNAASLSLQGEKGVITPRLTSNTQAKYFAEQIMTGMDNGKQVDDMINKLSEAYGDSSGLLAKELIAHGGLKEEYMPALLMGSDATKTQYLQNLKNKDELAALKATSTYKDELDYEGFKANEVLNEFISAIDSTNKGGKNLSISSSIAKGAMQEYERQVLSGTSHKDAMNNSVKMFISDNFDTITDGHAVVIPKKLNVDKERVSDFMQNSLSTSWLKNDADKNSVLESLEIDLPPAQKDILNKEPNRAKSLETLYKQHIRENGVWIWDGGDGAALYEKIVGTDNYAVVSNKMGKQIRLSYKEMENYNPRQSVLTAGNK